jgi:hypothetical protein
MLPSLSRGLRLALVLALSVGHVAWHGHFHPAAAAPKGGGDDDDSSGDDDDSGPKDEDDSGEDDKDQPLVTAGGLFTMKSYPVNELLRPLTITQNIAQLRLGLGTDLSAKGAFGSFGVSLEGQYGIADNFALIGGFTDAYNFKQFGVYAGFEGAIAYDLLDVRLAANLHRFAVPLFCATDPNPPTTCDATSATLPSGHYRAAGVQVSVDLGFPFRYSFTPQIAIVALQTLISIDFNGQQRGDPTKRPTGAPAYCSGVAAAAAGSTDTMGVLADQNNCIENGAKPDLNPSLGIATNPIPQLSLVAFAQLRIPDFDTSAGNFQVPVTGRVEFSPNQQLDIGLEFTLLNVKPPEGQSPIDNRFLSLFVQSRFGK